MKSKIFRLILAGVLLLCLCTSIVSASTRTIINPGAEVFIGEQGLDISAAMVGADTVIAWWPDGADPYTTAPSRTIDVSARINNFMVAPSDFVGYYGNWYSWDGVGPGPSGLAFIVSDPYLEPVKTWDVETGTYVTNGTVLRGDHLTLEINTNMYSVFAPGMRTNTGPDVDENIDLKVRNPTGAVYTMLFDTSITTFPITNLRVDTLPYSLGNNWYTGSQSLGWYDYSVGTYTVWAESTLNSMKDNYKNAGADYTGKTVSYPTTVILKDIVPDFTAAPTFVEVGSPVSFTDLSTGSPIGWAWFFGDENYTALWTEQSASAGWPTPSGADSVVLPDGSIVLMRDTDVWQSTNQGTTWTLQCATPAYSSDPHTSVALADGSIVLTEYVFGGVGYGLQAWRSTNNGGSWTNIYTEPGSYNGVNYVVDSAVLPDGTILTTHYHWMGGAPWTSVESSADGGVTWTGTGGGLPTWSPRTGFELTTMPDGNIIMTGGYDTISDIYMNDVWQSTDKGTTWIQQTANAGWTPRRDHTSVAMPDGSIVLMGGWNSSSIAGRDEVWRSTTNGVTWTLVTSNAAWPARTGATSVAMPDGSIVLMGGASEPGIGHYNDTWRLNPIGSSAQNPSHTYTTPGNYSVALQAFTASDYDSIKKPAYIIVIPATGSIAVTSTPPGAAIILDGTPLGQVTPYTVTGLTAGYHHVNVTLNTPPHYPQEKSVKVVGGVTTPVDFTLVPIATPPGSLNVISNVSGAEIFIDGIDMMTTTPHTFSGYLGNHTVKLTYDNYFNASRPVFVPSGSTVDVYITMDPIPPAYTYMPDSPVLKDIKTVLKEELDDNTAGITASSSPDRLDTTTLTLWGVQPSITTPTGKSTVVFIDPDPKANWEHPCSYVFIDETGHKTVVSRMSPSPDLMVDQVAGTAADPAGENLNLIGSSSTPSKGGGIGNLTYLSPTCRSPGCGDNYAVLIDGGYDKYNNHIRYWNDISFMYQTLNKTYGYPKDHIQVLMSDGANIGEDRHNWTYPDGSILTDSSPWYFDNNMYGTEVTGPANVNQLGLMFTPEKIPTTAGKDIFIFTTGHGGWDPARPNGGEAFLYLWNKQYIYASDFVALLPSDARSISMVMEQCNSGGFVDPFMSNIPLDQKRMIATASAADEPSHDNGFSSTWTMAAAKVDVDEKPNQWVDLPFGEGDQMISFNEAFLYAQAYNPYHDVETPQYSTTGADAESQLLHACTEAAKTLKLTSPGNGDTWYIGWPRNITWGQTGLDPASPVVISLRNSSTTPVFTASVGNGSYVWTIPRASIKSGSTYSIRITNESNNLFDQKSLILSGYATAGRINVTSEPVKGADIYVDGLSINKITDNKSILGIVPGTHLVGVIKAGYKPFEGKYLVKPSNQLTNISITLFPIEENGLGMMTITSGPVPAEVVVDGGATGQMTPYSEQYPAGTYTVGVLAPFGYVAPEDTTLRIFNSPVSAEFTLTPEPWLIGEFTSPITMEGVVNTAKAGQTIPVKWHLANASGDISDPESFVTLRSYTVACEGYTGVPVSEIESGTSNAGLQYLGEGNWQYDWKTPKSYAGKCRDMYIEFIGGQTSPVAKFRFK